MHDVKLLVTDESGRLARWLRLLGYDTMLAPAQPFRDLYRKAYNEGRIVVTRNRRVKPSGLFRVVQLKSQKLEEELQQLTRELRLSVEEGRVLTRCDRCNVEVVPIDKASVKDRVPPYVLQTQQAFHICPSCHRVYWAATHWERARALFERLTK